MISDTLFVYIVISSSFAIPPNSASSNGSFLILILVILIICCLAIFFSLFIAIQKKTQRKALSRKNQPPSISSIKNESNRVIRKARTQFLLYFKHYSPGHVVQRNPRSKSASVEASSTVQESGIQNRQWLSLVKECVDLFDELERLLPDLEPVEQEMALHITSRLQEILTRSGVEVIAHDAHFDPARHRLVPPGQMPGTEQAPITIISPGFAVGRRVLRHARVRLTDLSSSSGE